MPYHRILLQAAKDTWSIIGGSGIASIIIGALIFFVTFVLLKRFKGQDSAKDHAVDAAISIGAIVVVGLILFFVNLFCLTPVRLISEQTKAAESATNRTAEAELKNAELVVQLERKTAELAQSERARLAQLEHQKAQPMFDRLRAILYEAHPQILKDIDAGAGRVHVMLTGDTYANLVRLVKNEHADDYITIESGRNIHAIGVWAPGLDGYNGILMEQKPGTHQDYFLVPTSRLRK
jgi:hypothetical protein